MFLLSLFFFGLQLQAGRATSGISTRHSPDRRPRAPRAQPPPPAPAPSPRPAAPLLPRGGRGAQPADGGAEERTSKAQAQGLRPGAREGKRASSFRRRSVGLVFFLLLFWKGWPWVYLGLPTCAKLLLFRQKLCLLTQRRLFSPAGSFQCLHTLASIKIAKRRNSPSKRRNLPAKRRFFLPGSELDSRRELFLRKSVFFSNRRKLLLFWETALILHVGRSRYFFKCFCFVSSFFSYTWGFWGFALM